MTINILTVAKINHTKPIDKIQHLLDGEGLLLEIRTTGGKYWRFRYTYNGKANWLSLGKYPYITLAEARQKRIEYKTMLAHGINPSDERKKAKAIQQKAIKATTFEDVATEWYKKKSTTWSVSHRNGVSLKLKNHILPMIGTIPIDQITKQQMIECLRKIEEKGVVETAKRSNVICNQVFEYAIITNRATINPTINLAQILTATEVKHHAAITEPDKLGKLLADIEAMEGTREVVKVATQLLPMLLCRPGELCRAEWSEIDFNKATWTISGHKMKTKQDHCVPLSNQALRLFRKAYAITGQGQWVFPMKQKTTACIWANEINAALRSIGYESDTITGHGFRATARTMLEEQLHYPYDLIEHQLAHKVNDPLGRAYNRTTKLPERKEMIQKWADYLDQLTIDAQNRINKQ
ncbi:MAG: integrase arm-type DNA-binding domain-containing protein [Magnetococcales bacterium]|nr:integrase arm-type DNA-binding domain-containing protein [Magnetococcales bacterium]